MPQYTGAKKLAVLIDGENVSHELADNLFANVLKIGEASVRRVYGDFSSGHLQGWANQLSAHGIVAMHQPQCVKGKNAADIALVIDAMDLLLKSAKWLDGYCIVSSDSDFTRLASYIREEGREVFGFGKSKTPAGFQVACKQFIVLQKPSLESKVPAKPKSKSRTVPKLLLPVSNAEPILIQVVSECLDDDGWADFTKVANCKNREHSQLKCKQFGAASLSKLFRKTGVFEFSDPKDGPLRVRHLRQARAA